MLHKWDMTNAKIKLMNKYKIRDDMNERIDCDKTVYQIEHRERVIREMNEEKEYLEYV